MPSIALRRWWTEGKAALDEIAAAHAAVGGSGHGRRYATLEINHAYALLLSSQFQRFCRDLHTEAVDHVVAPITPVDVRPMVRARLLEGRRLDHGNPNSSNLGSDFGRFNFNFWSAVRSANAQNRRRQRLLDDFATWRNAIAHRDFIEAVLRPLAPLQLRHVERWRATCGALAQHIDVVLRAQIAALVGVTPW